MFAYRVNSRGSEFIREEASTVDKTSSTLTMPSRINSLPRDGVQARDCDPYRCGGLSKFFFAAAAKSGGRKSLSGL
jgi:hypothetical protein